MKVHIKKSIYQIVSWQAPQLIVTFLEYEIDQALMQIVIPFDKRNYHVFFDSYEGWQVTC